MSDNSGNGVTTSLFTRHLEELEELQSGASSFEETPVYGDDEMGEPSLEWRRQLLEEAYTRVKQAKSRPLDAQKIYEEGTLIFDADEGKFGRVRTSVAGYLQVQFVRGGDREYGKGTSSSRSGRSRGKRVTASKLSSAKSSPSKATSAKGKAQKKAASGNRRGGGEDTNNYIRQNFKTMSNRELARRTGLSEHTIRRKLGEWGLKRDKR